MAESQTETQVVAKYDYKAENSQELSMKKGDRLLLVDDTKDWWKVRSLDTGKEGFVPSNFVKIAKPKASLFSTILKKHGGKKKSDGSKQQSCPSPSLNNGDTSLRVARTNGNNVTSTETYQLGQCMPACAKYLYTAQRNDEISLSKGERIMVIEKSSDGWWRGRKDNGTVGWFPSNYVEEVTSSAGPNSTQDGNLLYFTAAEAKSQSSPSHSSADIVLALYPFTGKNSGELTCEKGERLEVVVSEPDSDWVSVRNSRGETGVVPANYVTPLSSPWGEDGSERGTSTSSSTTTPASQSMSSTSNTSIAAVVMGGRRQFAVAGPLQDKDWYYGNISRNQCEEILAKFAEDGDFLIRDSESTAGHYTVSLKAPGRNKHFRVKNNSGMLEIGQQKFSNLDDLIEHYKKHPIFKQEAEKLFLNKPFTCPNSQDN